MKQKLYVARSREVAARKLGDEMMIMSGRDSTLFTLDEVATIIWESADGSRTLDEIVELRILPQFDVEHARAVQDAEELAKALAQRGILVVSREPILNASLSGESTQ
jgi:Coenzyme PQQ synthesis protein D (PqqD)